MIRAKIKNGSKYVFGICWNIKPLLIIHHLNTYDTPIPRLGDWYEEHFNFEALLDGIYTVFFRVSDTDNIEFEAEVKVRQISDLIQLYQNETSEKLKQTLNVTKRREK